MDMHVRAVLIAAGREMIGRGIVVPRSDIGRRQGARFVYRRARSRSIAMRLGCGMRMNAGSAVGVDFERQDVVQRRQATTQESDGDDEHRHAAFEYS